MSHAEDESKNGAEGRQETNDAELHKTSGQSQVYTATKDTLFTKKTPHVPRTHSLVCTSCLILLSTIFISRL